MIFAGVRAREYLMMKAFAEEPLALACSNRFTIMLVPGVTLGRAAAFADAGALSVLQLRPLGLFHLRFR